MKFIQQNIHNRICMMECIIDHMIETVYNRKNSYNTNVNQALLHTALYICHIIDQALSGKILYEYQSDRLEKFNQGLFLYQGQLGFIRQSFIPIK